MELPLNVPFLRVKMSCSRKYLASMLWLIKGNGGGLSLLTWPLSTIFTTTEDHWTTRTEPYALLSSFQPFPHNMGKSKAGRQAISASEILLNQRWLILTGLRLQPNRRDFNPLRMEVTFLSSSEADDGPSSPQQIYFAAHMSPKSASESVQPFASSDDSSALLEAGYSYDFLARASVYRRAAGRRKRCTDSLSLSSWQVRN